MKKCPAEILLELVEELRNKNIEETEATESTEEFEFVPAYELKTVKGVGDIVTILVPGCEASDFKVGSRGNNLVISYNGAEKYITDYLSEDEITYAEPWELIFAYSADDDKYNTTVKYTAGILKVIVPKKPVDRPSKYSKYSR